MNKKVAVITFCLVVILAFGLSLSLFSRNPSDCYGASCFNYAKNHCDNTCAKRGMQCMFPVRIYGACIGYYVAICHSRWGLLCENGIGYGDIDCWAYDPLCYLH